jgi:hypothetical protein
MASDLEKMGVDKLTEANYAEWSILMRAALRSKGCWGAVTHPADAKPPHQDDEKALALITLAVSKMYLPTVARCKTAPEAWAALATIYSSHSHSRIMLLKNQLTALKLQDKESITCYINRAQAISDQLAAADHALHALDVPMS